jgi:hypothetical protein
MRFALISFFAVTTLALAGCKSAPKAAPAEPSKAPNDFAAAKAEAKAQVDAAAGKATTAATTAAHLECVHGKDTRTLEVRAKDKGCELAYTKNGQEAVVSTSRKGTDHCQASLKKISDKLIAGGFTCK